MNASIKKARLDSQNIHCGIGGKNLFNDDCIDNLSFDVDDFMNTNI